VYLQPVLTASNHPSKVSLRLIASHAVPSNLYLCHLYSGLGCLRRRHPRSMHSMGSGPISPPPSPLPGLSSTTWGQRPTGEPECGCVGRQVQAHEASLQLAALLMPCTPAPTSIAYLWLNNSAGCHWSMEATSSWTGVHGVLSVQAGA
jgi:hypothetical protein